MKSDYQTRNAYNALTEQQKQEVQRIHRRVNLPGALILFGTSIYSLVTLIDFLSVLFGSMGMYRAAAKVTDFLTVLAVMCGGFILEFLLTKVIAMMVEGSHPYYTEKLGKCSFEMNRKDKGGSLSSFEEKKATPAVHQPVEHQSPVVQPETKTVLIAKPSDRVPGDVCCPQCGREQPAYRRRCFYCATPFVVSEPQEEGASVPQAEAAPAKPCCPKCQGKLTFNDTYCAACGEFIQ